MESLRFEILGPLRAWLGDQELDLGPAKQRAVLAVLLLEANQPVRTEQIIDAVWDDSPPENGANVVQKYIAGLRRVLEPDRSPRTPGELLVSTAGGYRLRVAAGGLDTDEFRALVDRARVARERGRLADAAAVLGSALAQSRNGVLDGFSGPYFDAARVRLAEERGAAQESWAEIELERGYHRQVAAELARLVPEFPLRERLRALQMLALYRCGRQAEALAVFRDARAFLSSEFGVEPGIQLQRMHQRILRSDPELRSPTATATPAPVRPQDGAGQPAVVQPAAAQPADVQPAAPTAPPGWATATDLPPVTMPPLLRPSMPVRLRLWVELVAGGFLPVYSCGMLTWAVFAYHAATRRSPVQAVVSLVYLFAQLIGLAIGYAGTDDDLYSAPFQICAFLTLFVGTVHAVLLSLVYHVQYTSAAERGALLQWDRAVRRRVGQELLRAKPDIARELHIGRPDLPPVFDDGGLIDLNGAPPHILATLPGVRPEEAERIAFDRATQGPFASVDGLVERGLLPVEVVASLRHLLIAGPVALRAGQPR